jgi:hypothetical protein
MSTASTEPRPYTWPVDGELTGWYWTGRAFARLPAPVPVFRGELVSFSHETDGTAWARIDRTDGRYESHAMVFLNGSEYFSPAGADSSP